MKADADLSPPGVAQLVSDFLEALDLDGVTPRRQRHRRRHLPARRRTPPRADRPPGPDPVRCIRELPSARLPAAPVRGIRPRTDHRPDPGREDRRDPARSARLRHAHQTPPDGRRGPPRLPGAASCRPGVRRDALKVLRGISNRQTLEAAERLRQFDRPTLIAWAPEDRFFKLRFAERLVSPTSRLTPGPDRGCLHLRPRGSARAPRGGDHGLRRRDSGGHGAASSQ